MREDQEEQRSPGQIRLRRIAWGILAFAVFALFGSSCFRWPPNQDLYIDNVVGKPDSHMFAAALRCKRILLPRGLLAMPNGGIPIVLRQAALIYKCNVDSSTATLLAEIPVPKEMSTNFQPGVMGWSGDTCYVSLWGRHRDRRSGEMRATTQVLEFLPDGTHRRVIVAPVRLSRTPDMGIKAIGETTVLRVSSSKSTIQTRTDLSKPFEETYRVDPKSCRLLPVQR